MLSTTDIIVLNKKTNKTSFAPDVKFTQRTLLRPIVPRISNNHKNMKRFHKDTKDFLSVIINLGKNIKGGDTVFYDGVKTSDLGSRAHVLKYLHGRMIFVHLKKNA